MHPVSRETETVFTAKDETDFRRTQKRGDYVTFSFFYGCSITLIITFNFTNFKKLYKIWFIFATFNSFKPLLQKKRKYKQICMYIHTYTTYVNMHTCICRRRTFKKNFSSNDKEQGTYFSKKINQELKQFRWKTGAIHVK